MKRKLSLLLAMVLAMTMVMGISVTAAPERPVGCPESVDPCEHPEASDSENLIYVYDTFGEVGVRAAGYDCQNGSYKECGVFYNECFADPPTLGKVYHMKSGSVYYYLCEDPSPTPTQNTCEKVAKHKQE